MPSKIDLEVLKPLIKRLAAKDRIMDKFMLELGLGFSNVFSGREELDEHMPDLVEMYVPERFSALLAGTYKLYKEKLGLHLDPATDKAYISAREVFATEMKDKIDYFKRSLRLAMKQIPISREDVDEENESDEIPTTDESTGGESSTSSPVLPTTKTRASNRLVKPVESHEVEVTNNSYSRRRGVVADQQQLVAAPKITAPPQLLVQATSRSLTDVKASKSVSPPAAQVETKRALVRTHKKSVKKILRSVLVFKNNKKVIPSHYYAYVSRKLKECSSAEMLKHYENEGGVLAIAFVKDRRNIQGDEKEIIGVFEQIRKHFTKELTTNKKRRLINQPSGGVFAAKYTTPDDLRRAVSITFGAAVKSLQILVEYFVQQFVNIGCLHPDTVAGNALGKPGLELLFKGTGLDDQVDHFDFPNFKRSKNHLSYKYAMTHHANTFDERLDGGCSLFINFTGKEDHLRRPDGNLIIIPAYSYCILRGNVAHSGTGNSEEDAVFKLFCYLDPVKYYRATNKYKDNVFLFNEFKHIVRTVEAPYSVVMNEAIMPYYCLYCDEEFYYTYPMCTACLSKYWKLTLSVDKTSESRVICTNSGRVPLVAGFEFPDPFPKGIVTKTEFKRRYAKLKGESLGQVPVSETHVLDLLSYKPFLASVKMQPDGYNSVLEFKAAEKHTVLKVVADIPVGGELIMRGDPWFVSPSFLVDVDEYALKSVLDGHVDGSMIVAAAHADNSGEPPLEFDCDDGLFYEDDEEYGDEDSGDGGCYEGEDDM